MTERAFGPQFVEERFGFAKGLFRLIALVMQQPSPGARHFLFGEQAMTPNRVPKQSTTKPTFHLIISRNSQGLQG